MAEREESDGGGEETVSAIRRRLGLLREARSYPLIAVQGATDNASIV